MSEENKTPQYTDVLKELKITVEELPQRARLKISRLDGISKNLKLNGEKLKPNHVQKLKDEAEMLNDELCDIIIEVNLEKNPETQPPTPDEVGHVKQVITSKFAKVGGGLRFWEI